MTELQTIVLDGIREQEVAVAAASMNASKLLVLILGLFWAIRPAVGQEG